MISSEKTIDFLSMKQAQQILELSKKHSVVGVDALDKYDPEGNFGFCFGRACYFHIDLLSRKSVKIQFVNCGWSVPW